MNIKSRILVLLLQLIILVVVTVLVTGKPVVNYVWYFSGLLAIIINPSLLEPWYPRPQDVLANTIIGLFLTFATDKAKTLTGWYILQIFLIFFFIITLILILSSLRKEDQPKSRLLNAAKSISRLANASTIYSVIFWLSIMEIYDLTSQNFWTLGGAWALMMILGKINWQALTNIKTKKSVAVTPLTMIGPSYLLVSSTYLPKVGTRLSISGAKKSVTGLLVNSISRADDVWGQILIEGQNDCSELMHSAEIKIQSVPDVDSGDFIGSIDEGSNNINIRFISIKPIEIGKVILINHEGNEILFQITYAEIEKLNIHSAAILNTKVTARQLGVFNKVTSRIENFRWVPVPCKSIVIPSTDFGRSLGPTDQANLIKIGTLIGTSIPIFIDHKILKETHMAILGMTRMGKTSIAMHIVNSMHTTTRITILDQSGEFISRRGLPRYEKNDDLKINGVSVFEPPKGSVVPDIALRYLNSIVDIAKTEYEKGEVRSRILLIDEAHQFIPEPTGLGFNAPGRDSAFQFGLLMMQVRKYGISIIFISQRTAVVAKSALSQCENIIAFKSVDQTGLDYLESFLGSEFKTLLPSLNHGEAVVFGPAISANTGVAINTFDK